MNWLNIILMGIGLAMDCCAISIIQGMTQKSWHSRALLMAFIFGVFHMGMPVIGFYAGQLFIDFLQLYIPWIALVLLGFIGGKMIWESTRGEKKHKDANWRIIHLLILAFATSIDVLTTGLLFAPYPNRLLPAILTIGGITAAFSLGGYIMGVQFGKRMSKRVVRIDAIGGLVLLLLGLKIWAENYLN